MNIESPQILLTNDDGISSPGLWAAAEALSTVGFVTVAAPQLQYSGGGRSLAGKADGSIQPTELQIGNQVWTCYAINGTPTQAAQYGIFSIMKHKPDLVVSGINYGENPTHDVTMSGTVGAAIEAASVGIPSIAISLELLSEDWFGYSRDVDFSTAAFFAQKFARLLLEKNLPSDVNVLNINVPAHATPETPWHITRLSHNRYFYPIVKQDPNTGQPQMDARIQVLQEEQNTPDTDIHVLKLKKEVSVTPLSIDLTSRVNLQDLETLLRQENK
jgi:5'-nucleotidase